MLSTLLVLLSLVASSTAADTVPIQDLFRPRFALRIQIDPSGTLAAGEFQQGVEHFVRVFDLRTGKHADPFSVNTQKEIVQNVYWVDEDTLLIGTVSAARLRQPRFVSPPEDLFVVALDRSKTELVTSISELRVPGWVVHPLPTKPREILFTPADRSHTVRRVRLEALPARGSPHTNESLDASVERMDDMETVASLNASSVFWMADHTGVVRAALSLDSDGLVHLRWRPRQDSRWRVVHETTIDKLDVLPAGFTDDGSGLLVLSNRGRDTTALFELVLKTGELGRLIYEHPSAEVVDIITDFGGNRVLGVGVLESGMIAYDFLEESTGALYETLAREFPESQSSVVSLSQDGNQGILFVSDSRDPGRFFSFGAPGGPKELAAVAPWLDRERLAKSTVFRTPSTDGLEVEAFFTRSPEAAAKPPLVVLAHGGPLGVRDDRAFNPTVQYLATLGFAVLQVNYRGSAGYGKAFLELGKGEWGEGIERDLNAAIDFVIRKGWANPERMCVAGSSYGGYSALISVIQQPKRFRCAATFAGVTDIALQFSSADYAATARGRAGFSEIVGDPLKDYAKLKRASPVYRVDELKVPVFVAHGLHDERVPPEHARRLIAMLDWYGKPYEWLWVTDSGHSFASPKSEIRYLERLGHFLSKHLGNDPTAGGSATGSLSSTARE